MDSAVHAAATDGWAGLTPTAIARRSGMSQRAVQSRFPQRPDLGAAIWRDRAGPALQAALHAAVQAPPASLGSAMLQLATPDESVRAAIELLIISMFEPVVRQAVDETLATQATQWCDPRTSPTSAAQRAYVLMLGLGLVAAGRRPAVGALDLSPGFEALTQALAEPTPPMPLPSARPVHVTGPTPFDTGDPIHDALLNATLEQVGELGFDGATTMSIAGAAGVSETTIFVRYPTKLAMFVDAASRQQAIAFRSNEGFTTALTAEYGPAVADAVNIREFLHPDLILQRAIYAEEVRISWHDPDLMERQEAEIEAFLHDMRSQGSVMDDAMAHLAYALGLGYALLPLLARDAWRLPFDVVTVPLANARRTALTPAS